jgi:hypothetical protein
MITLGTKVTHKATGSAGSVIAVIERADKPIAYHVTLMVAKPNGRKAPVRAICQAGDLVLADAKRARGRKPPARCRMTRSSGPRS